MKAKTILGTAALGLAFLTAAQADVTIEVTGASAFRKASLTAIQSLYTTGASFKFAHSSSTGNLTSSTRAIFQGTFPGVSGVTTIRTNFTGSVEGIRALAIPGSTHNVTYLAPSVLGNATYSSSGTEVGSATTTDTATAAEFAFSDVSKDSTPLASYSNLDGGAVGVVAFTMIANEGAPSNLTNVSSKQFQALFKGGYLPASVLTGNASDTRTVYATGRNDGSGTRTTYLAETGVGITATVQQYITNSSFVTANTTSINKIYRVPVSGNGNGTLTLVGGNRTGYTTNGSINGGATTDASTIWSQNLAGNGGYNSGSTLVTHLGYTSSSTEVVDATGAPLVAAGPITLVSSLATADAISAKALGAVILGYNGVKLDGIAAGGAALTSADIEKITSGAYTLWSFQQLYKRSDITAGDTFTVYEAIRDGIPAAVTSTSSGVTMAEMQVGREVDGGIVAP
jgi:hypothetical protein